MSCNFIEIHSIYTLYIFFITNKLWLLGPNAGLTLWRKHHIQITHRGRSAEILHLAENGEWAQLAQFLPNIMRSDTGFFCIFLHLRVSSQLGEGCSVMTSCKLVQVSCSNKNVAKHDNKKPTAVCVAICYHFTTFIQCEQNKKKKIIIINNILLNTKDHPTYSI